MKKAIIFLYLFSITLFTSAQFIDDEEIQDSNNDKSEFSEKLFFGGNLGFVFGSFTYINVSPIVGYRLTEQISAGTGLIYEYFNDQRVPGYKFQTSIYGGKIFAQSILFERVILYVENNLLSLEKKHFDQINKFPDDGRFMINVPWVGGGIYQDYGNGGIYLMVLFNLNTSLNSPYPSYEYRMGINF